MRKHSLILLAMVVMLSTASVAQPAFWNDIRAFRKADSLQMPGAGQILFVGSSSFTNWRDVQQSFPGYPIINRGFGGSTLEDVIRYAPDIIYPYNPSQVVIYCGENDLASADTVTPAIVYERFAKLFGMIRSRFADIPVVFVSIKPSPSRAHLMGKVKGANALIRDFLARQKNAVFVDVFEKMLDNEGKPMADIFVEDRLHMNSKGYRIWQQAIQPYLLEKQ